jgi:parafibromin
MVPVAGIASQLQATQLTQQQQLAASQKSRSLGYNRFDQERYGGKDETGGFSIDTKLTYQPNGGALSLTNPNASASAPDATNGNKLTQLINQQKPGSNGQTAGGPSAKVSTVSSTQPSSGSGKRTGTRPIIIIPATSTSLITMNNVLDILQELKYVSPEEKKKSGQNQNAPKDTEIVMHRRDDGHTIQFKVIDNVNKLLPQDW